MNYHKPVLVFEIIDYLRSHIDRMQLPKRNPIFIDATLGDAGHSLALLEAFPQSQIFAFDRDAQILERAKTRLMNLDYHAKMHKGPPFWLSAQLSPRDKEFAKLPKFPELRQRIYLFHDSYHCIPSYLAGTHFASLILLDLGVATYHFLEADRGFSFRDSTLDMRFSGDSALTAADLINHSSPKYLRKLFREYGEEPFTNRIVKAIVSHRPFRTATALAECIRVAVARPFADTRKRTRGPLIHPATRVFQALRIAVNEELSILNQALAFIPQILCPGGLLMVISFHSLEDRIAKLAFRRLGFALHSKPEKHADAPFYILTKKPLRPSAEEIETNPLARSARLRILQANANLKAKK